MKEGGKKEFKTIFGQETLQETIACDPLNNFRRMDVISWACTLKDGNAEEEFEVVCHKYSQKGGYGQDI